MKLTDAEERVEHDDDKTESDVNQDDIVLHILLIRI